MRFNHRLVYSNARKNSTAKSRYFRNQNVDLSSQLGYSSNPDPHRTASRTYSLPVARDSHFLTKDSRPSLSPINHSNSQANVNGNASRPNGQSTPNCYQSSCSGTNHRRTLSTNPLTDENNNTVSDAYVTDDPDDPDFIDAPLCFSYMRDLAIYGVPSDHRKKTWRKLLNWWMFSLTYDLKLFFRKEWKTVGLIVLLWIIFELWYCYWLGSALLDAKQS